MSRTLKTICSLCSQLCDEVNLRLSLKESAYPFSRTMSHYSMGPYIETSAPLMEQPSYTTNVPSWHAPLIPSSTNALATSARIDLSDSSKRTLLRASLSIPRVSYMIYVSTASQESIIAIHSPISLRTVPVNCLVRYTQTFMDLYQGLPMDIATG